MPESSAHMDYVNICRDFIKNDIVPAGKDVFILSDAPESIEKPPVVVGGVRPDVLYKHNGLLVIGEAKTEKDIDNPHSRKQYNCYFQECEHFHGIKHIVFCTTWSACPQLWNIVKRMKKDCGYKTHVVVLFELGKFKEG